MCVRDDPACVWERGCGCVCGGGGGGLVGVGRLMWLMGSRWEASVRRADFLALLRLRRSNGLLLELDLDLELHQFTTRLKH